MGSFADAVNRFTLTVEARNGALFTGCVEEVARSIVLGSEITGAPGQPVQTGALRASWQTVFESPTRAVIGTNMAYAEAIEDGVGPYGPLTLRSTVGGFHSAKMTIAAWGRIQAAVAARVAEP